MEIWDAIRIIKKRHCTCNENCIDVCKYGKDRCVYDMAIKALEKQIPKKLMRYELREDKVMCPHCANWIDVSSKVFCCYFCINKEKKYLHCRKRYVTIANAV